MILYLTLYRELQLHLIWCASLCYEYAVSCLQLSPKVLEVVFLDSAKLHPSKLYIQSNHMIIHMYNKLKYYDLFTININIILLSLYLYIGS